jgi:hypothetical protein
MVRSCDGMVSTDTILRINEVYMDVHLRMCYLDEWLK